MKYIDWDEVKNAKLKQERGIGFEDILAAMDENRLLDDLHHPKRPNQRQFVIEHNNYAFLVPYVEDEQKIFLKTILPSRKATKQYLKGGEK
jgi:uncharacterized DUF497 family protein